MITFTFWYISLILTVSAIKENSFKIFEYDQPEQLYDFLENTTKSYPNVTSLISLGLTFEERPIYCLKISKGNASVGTIITEFGAHGREWASHTSATHAILELLSNETYDELITKITWYIVPLLNPDGFMFSKTADQYWRKNRRPNPSNENCFGVDVNRNFPVKWLQQDKTCYEDYGGPEPSSENETLAIEQLFTIIPKGKVDVYVSVHSDAQCVLLPYAYTYNRPPSYDALYTVAKKLKNAMEQVGYPKYNIIQASQMYEAPGTVFDWVYDYQEVPLVFTLELPFSDEKHPRFRGTTSELIVIAKQCLAALEACALEILNRRQVVPLVRSSRATNPTKSHIYKKPERANNQEIKRTFTKHAGLSSRMGVAFSSLTTSLNLSMGLIVLR